jgi:hypothetical protein
MSNTLAVERREVIADYAGIHLTEEQFNMMIDKDPILKRELIHFCSPHGTADCEQLMNIVAKEIVGSEWPCYGDEPTAGKQLYKYLERLAVEKGYEVIK